MNNAGDSGIYIKPNHTNTPKVLDLGDGWEVFWLKTQKSRIAEGTLMRNFLLKNTFESIKPGSAMLSIRKNNHAYVTLYLSKTRIALATTQEGMSVPECYQHIVTNTQRNLAPKLSINGYLEGLSSIEDGCHKGFDGVYYNIVNNFFHSVEDMPAFIDYNGIEYWYKDGLLHRDQGPAIVYGNYKVWYKDGFIHRDDAPAITWNDKHEEWYRYGKLHRDDGPAVVKEDGTKEWLKDGVWHRLDGPAVIYPDGFRYWYKNGKLYLENGPTAKTPDPTQE